MAGGDLYACFNSIKVQLKVYRHRYTGFPLHGFNSIKVQLKVYSDKKLTYLVPKIYRKQRYSFSSNKLSMPKNKKKTIASTIFYTSHFQYVKEQSVIHNTFYKYLLPTPTTTKIHLYYFFPYQQSPFPSNFAHVL